MSAYGKSSQTRSVETVQNTPACMPLAGFYWPVRGRPYSRCISATGEIMAELGLDGQCKFATPGGTKAGSRLRTRCTGNEPAAIKVALSEGR